MLLDEKERRFIDIYMTQPIDCPARRYSEMLHAGDVSSAFLLDMEIFMAQISEHCHERWMFRRLYEDYQQRTSLDTARRNQPTTQEQDQKAYKKSATKIKDWFLAARLWLRKCR